ncbi:GNAT family N-acetyltransferase [Spiractinospora alimapuensis]|uniref:GNAT family N-acetyltransferase n=1 Tax=Spiractinospora alimapuensis TaxID=2820884 RepID=UPI001F32E996|nr:GNAT family N-acetyltransferase [Spiractinospora alimapuensis]QVQ51187.1 GNAT family N-acetyltransferase [Spiractinospora alimapuensis]
MQIRAYRPSDARPTLDVFRRAVHQTARRDYTEEQVDAWAPELIDVDVWAARRAQAETLVAVADDHVLGFCDLDPQGHIDMLFVDPAWGRRGVASQMLDRVMARARARGLKTLTTYASLTARPFFERHGFTVTEERWPEVRGVRMRNFAMVRRVAGDRGSPSGQKLP